MKHISLLLTLSFFVFSSDAICQNSKTKKLEKEFVNLIRNEEKK